MEMIESIQAAIGIVTKLRELSKKLVDAEFKMLLADLSNDLADAKLQASNLKTELADLKTQFLEQREKMSLQTSTKPRFENGGYIFEGDESLYCTGCFDSGGKKIRLNKANPPFTTFGKWDCPVCKQYFN
jgi:hypothetical protein